MKQLCRSNQMPLTVCSTGKRQEGAAPEGAVPLRQPELHRGRDRPDSGGRRAGGTGVARREPEGGDPDGQTSTPSCCPCRRRARAPRTTSTPCPGPSPTTWRPSGRAGRRGVQASEEDAVTGLELLQDQPARLPYARRVVLREGGWGMVVPADDELLVIVVEDVPDPGPGVGVVAPPVGAVVPGSAIVDDPPTPSRPGPTCGTSRRPRSSAAPWCPSARCPRQAAYRLLVLVVERSQDTNGVGQVESPS